MQRKAKSTLTTLIRIIITLSLLVYVFSNVNFKEFLATLTQINILYLIIILAISILQSAVSTWGWKIALQAFNFKFTYIRLFYYYYIGCFFSLSLPGAIGGDAVKIYYVGKENDKKYIESFASLAVQRILSFLTFIFFFLIPVLLFSNLLDANIRLTLLSLLLILFIISILSVYFPGVKKIAEFLINKLKIYNLNEKIHKLLSSLFLFKKKRKTLGFLILNSFMFYLSSLILRYFILRMLDIELELEIFFAIVIFVTFMVQIPISFAGVGIREGTYLFFFTKYGISPEVAISFSLLEYIPGFILSNLTGLIYLIKSNRLKEY